MEEQVTKPGEVTVETPEVTEVNEEDEGRVTAHDRLLEVYDQIAGTDDMAYKLAAFMTITHYYSYSLRIANQINSRQGKNRAVISGSTGKLMAYSLNSDIDEVSESALIDLYVDIINTYLVDKMTLPDNKPKVKAVKLSRAKAIFMMLITTGQYDIVYRVTIPTYLLKIISRAFDNIRSLGDDVINSWLEYLEQSGNTEMIDITKAAGSNFWGSEGIKANEIYERYYGSIEDKIKNPIETYQVYLQFRADYRKVTKRVLPSRLYDIFDMTPDAYNRARRNVYRELTAMYPQDENISIIKKLIFEQ